jgi:phosphohistidine phosphatase
LLLIADRELPTRLIFVRHGIAEAAGSEYPDDGERPLSDRGRRRTKETALGFEWLKVVPTRIVTSPLLRARQTADILQGILAPEISLEICQHLAPGGEPEEALAWLEAKGGEEIVLVGHLPDLAQLAVLFVSDQSHFHFELKRAGACRVDFEGPPAFGTGSLRWLLTPRILRGLARLI